MPYLILGLAVLVGLYFVVRGLRGTSPRNLQRVSAIVIGLVAAAFVVLLTFSGRLGPFGWVLLALPLLFRWRAIMQAMKNMRGPTPGRNSDIETAYLRMTLEHDSGVLRGTVLQGKYGGKNLDELSLEDLIDLLHECRVNDPQSGSVLESYLDRLHGAAWREAAGEGMGDGTGDGQAGAGAGAAGMTPEQAYEILGLQPGASDDDIREAHRRLLKANHPDRGGSTWVAAQINLAKDLLLPNG